MELMFNTNPTSSSLKYFGAAVATYFLILPTMLGVAALAHYLF